MSKHSSRGAEWNALRLKVLERDHYTCVCGRPATTVDHIIPKAKGGVDSEENLQAMCISCNGKKQDRILERGLYLNEDWFEDGMKGVMA